MQISHVWSSFSLVVVRDYGGYLHNRNFNGFHHLLNCSDGDLYVKELRTAIAAVHGAERAMDDLDIRVCFY